MAIQTRRGVLDNLDTSKLLPGEWACVTGGDGTTNGTAVYMCFSAGNVKRMVTAEELQSVNELITDLTAIEIEIVETLPIENIKGNVIYLLSADSKITQYMHVSGNWVKIRSLDVDLSEYIKREEANIVYAKQSTFETLKSDVTEKAPTNHASDTTDYGIGTAEKYGHLKVTSGNGLSVSNGILSMSQIVFYGTCATAAGTIAKVVTCSGFTLSAGVRVAVYFSYANTVTSPTLNINGTGAIAIARLSNWADGATVEFVYNGTNWVALETHGKDSYYGTCLTTAGVTGKTVTCTEFNTNVLVKGTRVSVTFTYANTADNPTLNVNGTGAIAIYIKNAVATAYSWGAGQTITFVYSGSYWYAVSEPVYNSGWVSISNFTSPFQSYSAGYAPQIKRIGDVVYMKGAFTTSTSITISGFNMMATLPDTTFYPTQVPHEVAKQGSGSYRYKLTVTTDGYIQCSSYSNTATSTNTVAAGSYYELNTSWAL